MNLLLDTHVLLWWLADDPRLEATAREAVASADSVVYVSAVSVWEIAIKQGLGKLELPTDFYEILGEEGFRELPVTWEHARRCAGLPWVHRDPFDRMLVVQAQTEDLTIVTADDDIRRYDVRCLKG